MSVSAESLAPRLRARRDNRRTELIAELRAALASHPPGAGVRTVLLFGSWARGDFEGGSDIDLLVLTDPGTPPDAFDTAGLPNAQRLDVILIDRATHQAQAAANHPFHARVAREAVVLWT